MFMLPYSEELDIKCLGRLFDNTSNCYKFFWFKSIIEKVIDGKMDLTYEELVDNMIADAWYMVTEYHLNLGPNDTLEKLVEYIREMNPDLKSCEKKADILKFLKETKDKKIIGDKRTLVKNVPYRLQAPFMEKVKGEEWKAGQGKLIEKINTERRLMYYFVLFDGLRSRIKIQKGWAEYLIDNREIIKGWLEYNMIIYLQRRNPSVPGIADKLYPPQKRKLEKVKKFWKMIVSLEPVCDIYGGNVLDEREISIDHFVPWSYVAHDEMWNLNPTTRSINSSKSNNLPDWECYIDKLAKQEYQSYQLMWKNDKVHEEFDKCAKEHINNDEVRDKLYSKGLSYDEFADKLFSVIKPVYESAKSCGFSNWIYQVEAL